MKDRIPQQRYHHRKRITRNHCNFQQDGYTVREIPPSLWAGYRLGWEEPPPHRSSPHILVDSSIRNTFTLCCFSRKSRGELPLLETFSIVCLRNVQAWVFREACCCCVTGCPYPVHCTSGSSRSRAVKN